jgi:hypothetical protein
VRETDTAIYVETRAAAGGWIARSYVPKATAGEDASTPDAIIANILQTGEVDGKTLAGLGDREVALTRDTATGQWSAKVGPSFTEEQMQAFMRSMSEWRPVDRDRGAPTWGALMLAANLLCLLPLLRRQRFAIARGIRRCGRALSGAARQAFRLGAAVATSVAMAVIGVIVGTLGAIRYLAGGGTVALVRLSNALANVRPRPA